MHYVCYVNNWIVDKDWKIFGKQFMDMKEYWNFLKSYETLSLKTIYLYICHYNYFELCKGNKGKYHNLCWKEY